MNSEGSWRPALALASARCLCSVPHAQRWPLLGHGGSIPTAGVFLFKCESEVMENTRPRRAAWSCITSGVSVHVCIDVRTWKHWLLSAWTASHRVQGTFTCCHGSCSCYVSLTSPAGPLMMSSNVAAVSPPPSWTQSRQPLGLRWLTVDPLFLAMAYVTPNPLSGRNVTNDAARDNFLSRGQHLRVTLHYEEHELTTLTSKSLPHVLCFSSTSLYSFKHIYHMPLPHIHTSPLLYMFYNAGFYLPAVIPSPNLRPCAPPACHHINTPSSFSSAGLSFTRWSKPVFSWFVESS